MITVCGKAEGQGQGSGGAVCLVLLSRCDGNLQPNRKNNGKNENSNIPSQIPLQLRGSGPHSRPGFSAKTPAASIQ